MSRVAASSAAMGSPGQRICAAPFPVQRRALLTRIAIKDARGTRGPVPGDARSNVDRRQAPRLPQPFDVFRNRYGVDDHAP